MKIFNFAGSINSSKSMMNRAQILKSYEPQLELRGFSNCDDVQELKLALDEFSHGKTKFNLGHGGTTLRFFALRVSREPGEYFLQASSRLLDRPSEELFSLLKAVGVEVVKESTQIIIRSTGWKKPSQTIPVDVTRSSQFLSSLILNSWNLPFDLEFNLQGKLVSEPYFNMTLEMCRSLGLEISKKDQNWSIAKNQIIQPIQIKVEPDMSSAFSVAALAALYGEAHFSSFVDQSLQPDFQFIEVLKKMGAKVLYNSNKLTVQKGHTLEAIHISLQECPDLFPVLAVLCSFAKGESHLYGAPQLVFKESQRIQKISELLNLYGVLNRPQNDGMIIHGQGQFRLDQNKLGIKKYSTDNDHRLAMAAALFQFQDPELVIENPEVVQKSFPEFWDIFSGLQCSDTLKSQP